MLGVTTCTGLASSIANCNDPSSSSLLFSPEMSRSGIAHARRALLCIVPVTFPAHQAIVLPLKLLWPTSDAIALCIGSAAPDLSYALLQTRWQFDSHYTWRAIAWGLPVTVALTWLIRNLWFANASSWAPRAMTASMKVSASRLWTVRSFAITVMCALLGIASHVTWDAFTHGSSPVISRVAWMRDTALHWPIPITGARLGQYLGHTVGSVFGLWLYVRCARRVVNDQRATDCSRSTTPLTPALGRWPLHVAMLFGSLASLLSWILIHHEFAGALLRGFWMFVLVLSAALMVAKTSNVDSR
jgi:hypothetical protein